MPEASGSSTGPDRRPAGTDVWTPGPPPWGWADVLALAVWTAAIVAFFWDAVALRRALFYFDITELNYPYRAFFARELRAGRFTFWCPGLYCGMPLFSESQAGYLHPLKYLLYPWLATWQAFNLDTIGSIWLTGLGSYGWLRRHVGPAGALTGASVLGLSGYTWSHFVHTSMMNALASLPLAFWALETAWAGGRLRPLALGSLALACQVFAGHLQDALMTGMALGLFGVYRAAIERGRARRLIALGSTVGMIGLAVLLAAVQWVPSKELIDRSPRAGGLSWGELTFGSWSPELLPTLAIRETFGTLARDTDWMDGFYPFQEMDTTLGVAAIALAIVGAAAYRDRWVGFWPILAGAGGLLMLGRYTFLMDLFPRIPILGSGRIPVRYHLWVALATAALAAVGVDRLTRPGRVKLRWAAATLAGLALVSIPMLYFIYEPLWSDPQSVPTPYHRWRTQWLTTEWGIAALRTALVLGAFAWLTRRRRQLAWALPLLVLGELLASHIHEAPSVPPTYWTQPPRSVANLKPGVDRIFGMARFAANEPGYAVRPVNFFAVRDPLAWSLPLAWGLATSGGHTPIHPMRLERYDSAASRAGVRFELEAVNQVIAVSSRAGLNVERPIRAGIASIYPNPRALPRARLMGLPVYARDERDAARTLLRIGRTARDHLIVEDPDRPLAPDARPRGSAAIVRDEAEHVEVTTDSDAPSYLFLADSFDPGWSATIDNQTAPIRPAYIAFRAVYLPAGRHRVIFEYHPAGFALGLAITCIGLLIALVLLAWPGRPATLGPEHGDSGWPRAWPALELAVIVAILIGSTVGISPGGKLMVQARWTGSFHRFTWGAKIEAIRPPPPPPD